MEATRELEEIFNEEAKGYYIRSRAKIYEESPENLKYFSKLETKNSKAKYIKSLYVGNNLDTLITDPSEILEAQMSFYSDLYKEPSNIIQNSNIFQNIEIPQLNETDKNLCEKQITLEELSKSLKQ